MHPASAAAYRLVPLGCGDHLRSKASTRLRRAGVFPVGKPPFPCGESNQSQVRLADSWHEASLQRRPRPDLPWSGVHRPAICPRQIASVASHSWTGTCAPCSRVRLRCSASPTGAEDQEPGVGTIHQSNGVPNPTARGRAFDLRLFTPFGAADTGGISPQGERKGCARAPHARDGDRRAPQAAANPRSGRDRRGNVSLAPFFQKKGARSAAAERNQAVCRCRRRSQMFRCADSSLCSATVLIRPWRGSRGGHRACVR